MTDQSSETFSEPPWFARGLAIQARVIGALIMRELHTRYGRENVGYLWVVLEPMMLAVAIAFARSGSKGADYTDDIRPVPFVVCGYCVFILFRSVVSRSEGTLESNGPMLYHRMVSVFDMLFARLVLEASGAGTTLAIMICFITVLGYGSLPARPLDLIAGFMAMVWFSFSLSMIICAITHENRTAGRLVHPVMYLTLPLSGCFYQISWLPEPFRGWMSWFPLAEIFEQVRYGEFSSATNQYVKPLYLIGWFMALTWVGMVAIKHVRNNVHLS